MHPVWKVLDGGSSRNALSRETLSCLENTKSVLRVEFEKGDDDWVTLSISKALQYLIQASPNFEQLLESVIARSGAHRDVLYVRSSLAVATAYRAAVTTACFDHG